MRRSSLCLALSLAGLLGSCATAGDGGGRIMELRIDPATTWQEIEHFGASAAWWAQYVGTWPEATREAILDLLFDPVKGIGLDLVRYNIGGGKAEAKVSDPWRSAESPLLPDGSLDWGRDAAAMSIVDGAVERGARVLLFWNSPPASMTISGAPTGKGAFTNLAPGSREEFARYMARCALELGKRWPLVALSPLNEPQWDWQPAKGQEGSFYSPDDVRGLLAVLVRVLREEGVTTPLSVIDSGEWSLAKNKYYIDALLADPEVREAVGHYAVHSYWSAGPDREDLAAWFQKEWPGLRVWMTEWTEMRGEKDVGMQAALALANTVHEDLCLGNASSWQYWIALSRYRYADGLLYVNERAMSFETTKKLWALGNWSKFVQPGAFRIACETDPGTVVRASAFRNPDGSIAIVVVNGSADESAPTRLIGPEGSPNAGGLQAWETSALSDLAPRAIPHDGILRFPGESVTTLLVTPTQRR